MSETEYNAALDLLRRLDPKNIKENLHTICQFNNDIAEDLLSTVDTPLTIETCPKTKKKYLCCDYNRDGDSYKSPWTGEYYPEVEDAPTISSDLRKLEVSLNDAFDTFRDLYYEGGLSSVYVWDQDDGFAGVVLIKKSITKNWWDSIHVFNVDVNGRSANYQLTSTVILGITGGLDLTGNLTRQQEKQAPVEDEFSHVANLGQLIEEMEFKLRNMLNEVYFGKTRDIISDIRTVESQKDLKEEREREGEVAKSLG